MSMGNHTAQEGRPSPGALLGVSEIAERLGVQQNTVVVWQRRHADFPEPLVKLAHGSVWWAPDIDRWYQNRPTLSAGHFENDA